MSTGIGEKLADTAICSSSSTPPSDETMIEEENIPISGERSMIFVSLLIEDGQQQQRNKRIGTGTLRVITADTTHTRIESEHIIEYEWPVKSGERYFIQEQIAQLLDVKSFKRKYPDLSRRAIEVEEKDFLLHTFELNTVMNDYQMQGLTAIRAIEVRDLMQHDYPDIYAEYQKAAADKMKKSMAEKQKALDAIKLDQKKMAELRKNAIRSAAEFNSELQERKRTERKYFWDLQTNIIQSSSHHVSKLRVDQTTTKSRYAPYPVALMNGQYQEYYRRFTPDELRRLPLGSVLDYDALFPPRRPPSPPPIVIEETEIADDPEEQSETGEEYDGAEDVKPDLPPKLEVRRSAGTNSSTCAHCDRPFASGERAIVCTKCRMAGHAECLQISPMMLPVVLSYDWQCIDCRHCTVCAKVDREESMMFCDRCDRGYHTFCVGLDAPPNGQWICDRFCRTNTVASNGRRRSSITTRSSTAAR